ncbi:MAG: ABC transporter permease [Clostridia bacterium]|nr:ABC transporter permease [Clostridia bacterium]
MLLPFKIALRFLKSAKGQTLLITLGIAIGVSVQIFIGLLIQGLQTSLIDKTIGSASHITIRAEGSANISDYDAIIDEIGNVVGVKVASATLDNPALININSENISLLVRGVTVSGANIIYKLNSALTSGELPSGGNTAIIGKTLFDSGGFALGDTITVFVPDIGNKPLVISGVFDLKVSAINRSWVITDISTAQALFNIPDVASSIEVQINDVFQSVDLADTVAALPLVTGLKVVEWQGENGELLSGLSGQSVSSIMIQVFVIIAVVLGIASVLAISVLQKSKQIGILKAMGIKDSAASVIFLTQGFVLGILGAVALTVFIMLHWGYRTFFNKEQQLKQ